MEKFRHIDMDVTTSNCQEKRLCYATENLKRRTIIFLLVDVLQTAMKALLLNVKKRKMFKRLC